MVDDKKRILAENDNLRLALEQLQGTYDRRLEKLEVFEDEISAQDNSLHCPICDDEQGSKGQLCFCEDPRSTVICRAHKRIRELHARLAKPWDEPGAEPCSLCSWADGVPAKYCSKCFGARSKP